MDAAGGLVEWLDNRGLAGCDPTGSVAQSSEREIRNVSNFGDLPEIFNAVCVRIASVVPTSGAGVALGMTLVSLARRRGRLCCGAAHSLV